MNDEYHGLSDREILILLRNDFVNDRKERDKKDLVVDKRLDSHAKDIKDLRAWRYYLGGAIGALGAYFGFKVH